MHIPLFSYIYFHFYKFLNFYSISFIFIGPDMFLFYIFTLFLHIYFYFRSFILFYTFLLLHIYFYFHTYFFCTLILISIPNYICLNNFDFPFLFLNLCILIFISAHFLLSYNIYYYSTLIGHCKSWLCLIPFL